MIQIGITGTLVVPIKQGTGMKLRAKDTFHASGIGKVHARQEFETHDALGQELVDKGHAEILEGGNDTPENPNQAEPREPNLISGESFEQSKAEPEPLNKAEPAPKNKRRKAETSAEPVEPEDE